VKQTAFRGEYRGATKDVRGVRKGKISRNRRARHPVWQEDHGEIYMTCYECGTINRITAHVRRRDGRPLIYYTGLLTEGCVTCTHCKVHNVRVRLVGWKGPCYRECPGCCRHVSGTVPELKRWGSDYCPRCWIRM